MPYARIGGIDINYEEHGAGSRVLVMAHGALGSINFADTFGLKASALAARGLRVIAYDARGHGLSGYSPWAKDYEKRALARELLGLLDALGLVRVSICGTSMGATSALLVAQDHPDRIDRLVLRSVAPFGADMTPVKRTLYAMALSYQGTRRFADRTDRRASPGSRWRASHAHAPARPAACLYCAGATRISRRAARHGSTPHNRRSHFGAHPTRRYAASSPVRRDPPHAHASRGGLRRADGNVLA